MYSLEVEKHHTFCMDLYHKRSVETGFTFALQFVMLISDGLGGVLCNNFSPKEVCNRGHGLSAAINPGSLEKPIGVLLLHSGVY